MAKRTAIIGHTASASVKKATGMSWDEWLSGATLRKGQGIRANWQEAECDKPTTIQILAARPRDATKTNKRKNDEEMSCYGPRSSTPRTK